MISLSYLASYLRHQIASKNAHGLHSPLAFSLYTHVFKGAAPAEAAALEAIRASLLADKTSIQVLDLGAGSMHSKGTARTIAEIARHALKPPRLARFLYRLARWKMPEIIIELGTSLGLTSAYLSRACPGARIISIEGSPAIAAEARKIHLRAGTAVEVRVGNFDTLLPGVLEELKTDNFMLYIDGNHQYQATLNYFEMGMQKAGERTLFVFDDIHWSKGMEKAWTEIKADSRVSCTVDQFFVGLVFTDGARAKQDFSLRFF